MSVTAEPLHIPSHENQVVSVIGTEIPGIGTNEIDEEPSQKIEKAKTLEPTGPARAKPLHYTKEEIFAVKESPLSQIRPSCLSDKYCNRDGIWDPELWYYSEESEKRSASPIDSKKKFLLDGIVLSPQGRSFARGCQVSQGKQSSEKQERDGKNKTSGRVGRGWEPREPRERNGPQKGRVSPSGDSRFERNAKSEKYNGRTRRTRSGNYESQPEWFTHGPTSQQDTIELRGFDEGERENKRKKQKKGAAEASSNKKQPNTDDLVDENKKFDINQFFDMAENTLPISGVYENQITSRFSQWFHEEGRSRSGSFNASQNNSRRSSITEELAEIAGLTLSSPVGTPTHDQDFMFTPIVPATKSSHEDTVPDVLQESEIDVQPLLDSVIPHKTVKGAMNLEDLEGERRKSHDEIVEPEEKKDAETEEREESAEAFVKLVETMKACGNLPEKPTPTIPDIPPHLLPRPPSAKDRSRTASPRLSRSPSPLQLLQEAIRRTQSPVGFVGSTTVPSMEPRLVSPFDALHDVSPVVDLFTRPLTPEELYGAPPAFNINTGPTPDLFEFTGSGSRLGTRPGFTRKQNLQGYTSQHPEQNTSVKASSDGSGQKSTNTGYPVISQAFVPTSVLRKLHSEKHDQKSSEVKENEKKAVLTSNYTPSKTSTHPVAPQRKPLFEVSNSISSARSSESFQSYSNTGLSGRSHLMSPHEFSSPKCSMESDCEPSDKPEFLTPHRLPLPGSPTSLTPQSLPLPPSPFVRESPSQPTSAPAVTTRQRLLTPHSLPLPQSPLVNGTTSRLPSNGPSNFGIRPLPRAAGIEVGQHARTRKPVGQDPFKRPLDQSARHNLAGTNNMRRFSPGQVPFRGQTPGNQGMMRRPGLVPNPYTANLGRGMNVHPTALALALRNQQYQMARAAAVAAATAAVNRPQMMSPAAAAAALMFNQQRATAALHGFMPSASPRMFQQQPLRPNLPPALQHQHHVVHRSDGSKETSLSKWFSDAVLRQSQSKPAAPGRGAKVLSVEELERHA